MTDDGSDMNVKAHFDKKYKNLKIFGATEETTAGVNRIKAVEKQGKLRYPVISVNDAYTKHKFDNRYGTLKQPVLDYINSGKDVLFDIDWQVTKQLKEIKKLSLITFFILPPNIKTLKERLLNRHKGQKEMIDKRMSKFNEEVSHWKEYNYIVINDDLNKCYKSILDIINSAKKGNIQTQDLDKIKEKIKELTK